jgi:hypothetical protein
MSKGARPARSDADPEPLCPLRAIRDIEVHVEDLATPDAVEAVIEGDTTA